MVLDLRMPLDVVLNEGDKVRIDLNMETFKHVMDYEKVGWNSQMEQVGRSILHLNRKKIFSTVSFS